MSEDVEDYELEEEVYDPEEEDNSIGGIVKKNAPIFMASVTLHAFVLMIVALIPVNANEEQPKEVTVIQEIEEKEEPPPPPEIEEIEIEEIEVEIEETETEVEEETEEVEEVEEAMENEAEVEPDVISEVIVDTPSVSNAPPSLMALTAGGGGGGGGLPHGFGGRSKRGKRRGLGRHGGKGTQDFLELALKWLAYHQEPNGTWDLNKYQGHAERDKDQIGATAIPVLAFLGAGYSETIGPPLYKNTVRKGIKHLNDILSNNPGQLQYGNTYASAAALQCLSEAVIFGSSPITKKNANRLAQYLMDHLGDGPVGWGYNFKQIRHDFSVSGWVALGLKDAKAAGLESMKTPQAKDVLTRYKKWVDTVMTNYDGEAAYAEGGNQNKAMTKHGNMVPVGIFQKFFLGSPKTDGFIANSMTNMDLWGMKHVSGGNLGTAYNIYYSALSCFQYGGDNWKKYNEAMKKAVITAQIKGDPKQLGGSWDPPDGHFDKTGGRVLVTALLAMCLEVYYRYESF